MYIILEDVPACKIIMKTRGQITLSRLEWIALALVVLGALNWGLVGLGGFIGAELNLVTLLFGSIAAAESLVYVIVGLSGLYLAYLGYQLYGARMGDTELPTDAKGTGK